MQQTLSFAPVDGSGQQTNESTTGGSGVILVYSPMNGIGLSPKDINIHSQVEWVLVQGMTTFLAMIFKNP